MTAGPWWRCWCWAWFDVWGGDVRLCVCVGFSRSEFHSTLEQRGDVAPGPIGATDRSFKEIHGLSPPIPHPPPQFRGRGFSAELFTLSDQ